MPPQLILPPPPPRRPRDPAADRFSKSDWILFALAGLDAVLAIWLLLPKGLSWALAPSDVVGQYRIPGFGLTGATLAHLAIVLIALRGKARLDRTTIPLLAASAVLALLPSLTWNPTLRVYAALVAWGVGILAAYLASGLASALHARTTIALTSALEAVELHIASAFSNLIRPIRALQAERYVRATTPETLAARSRVRAIALGVALAALLLMVVVPMLISADAMFSQATARLMKNVLSVTLPTATWRLLQVAALWPLLFGVLWGLARSRQAPHVLSDVRRSCAPLLTLPALTAIILLGAAVVVYALFLWVQALYLFGGAKVVGVAGGYASYARSGFFELVTVAAINVAVALAGVRSAASRSATSGATTGAASATKASKTSVVVVRVLVFVLIAQTVALLASAVFRMNLYVDTYGLTLLRMLTYLGMAFIVVALAGLAVEAVRSGYGYFRLLVWAGIVLWTGFIALNPDGRIAEYNVESFRSGHIEQLDLYYFPTLGPAGHDALRDLEGDAKADPEGEIPQILRDYWEDPAKQPWQLRSVTLP